PDRKVVRSDQGRVRAPEGSGPQARRDGVPASEAVVAGVRCRCEGRLPAGPEAAADPGGAAWRRRRPGRGKVTGPGGCRVASAGVATLAEPRRRPRVKRCGDLAEPRRRPPGEAMWRPWRGVDVAAWRKGAEGAQGAEGTALGGAASGAWSVIREVWPARRRY